MCEREREQKLFPAIRTNFNKFYVRSVVHGTKSQVFISICLACWHKIDWGASHRNVAAWRVNRDREHCPHGVSCRCYHPMFRANSPQAAPKHVPAGPAALAWNSKEHVQPRSPRHRGIRPDSEPSSAVSAGTAWHCACLVIKPQNEDILWRNLGRGGFIG